MTVSTTHAPATDLGYLLHKHPDRVQEFEQSFGTATVFYPEAGEDRCTVALTLEIDPIRLARSRARDAPDFSLPSTSTTARTPRPHCLASPWPTSSVRRAAVGAHPGRSSPTRRSRWRRVRGASMPRWC